MLTDSHARLRWPAAAVCAAALTLAPLGAASHFGGPLYPGHTYGGVNGQTAITGGVDTALLRSDNTSGGASATGVLGLHSASHGTGPAVRAQTNSQSANAFGLFALVNTSMAGSDSAAVRGQNNDTGKNGIGVWGSHAGEGVGVFGRSPNGRGVWGASTHGVGVVGAHESSTGTAPGVSATTDSNADFATALRAVLTSATPGIRSAAVRGQNNGAGEDGIGVWGSHASFGTGVLGDAIGGTGVDGQSLGGRGVHGQSDFDIGVFGQSRSGTGVVGASTTGNAGFFSGDVHITGALTKGGGAFRIDHPLDPAHKYLQHSFVESPDMLDVYNGNVVTDKMGFATIKLPAYFQALNRSFRYQLTILGTRGWNARVVKEIAHNRFTIETDRPRVKVSWQVTGIRHDRYANAHRIRVVVPKTSAENGKYLHPWLYGKSASLAIAKTVLMPPRGVRVRMR